jgi:hypothetical protein
MFVCCSLVAIDPCQLWTEQRDVWGSGTEKGNSILATTLVEGIFSNKVLLKGRYSGSRPTFFRWISCLRQSPNLHPCDRLQRRCEGWANIWFSLIPYTSSMNFWCQLLPTWNEEILEAGTFFLVLPICWPWKSYYSCQRDTDRTGAQRERERER